MARKPRVDDSELETDQLKDMLGNEKEIDVDDDEQDDAGSANEADDAGTDDDSGAGDEESAGGKSGERRSADEGNRGAQRSDGKQQSDNRDKRGQKDAQQKGQQSNADLALINKLDKDTQNAVMRQAIDFVRQRTQPVFNKLDMQVRKLNNELTVHRAAAKDAQEYGLNPQERNLGYRLVAAYKKDKIATIKYLLADAKKSGVNIDLGGEAGQSVDMQAIRGMINEALGPVRGEFENRQQEQEAANAAKEQLIEFYAEEPMAQIHEPLINSILQRFPQETLQTAWLKIQLHATRNGLDLSKPFDQQSRQQQPGNGGRPMNLRGNRNVQQRNANSEGEHVRFARPDAKWGDIIRETLAEQGFIVN